MGHTIHYEVPADKIGLVLSHLDTDGWCFKGATNNKVSIESEYFAATSRNWDGHKCVFAFEEWKTYKFIWITSDLLMKANKQEHEILPYVELIKRFARLGIK